MRKEVIIVILIGILIGAIVAFGIYTARTAISKQETQVEQTPETPTTPTQASQSAHTLTIIDPKNESVSDQEEITITGQTSPDAVIAIIGAENEYLLTADGQGNFSTKITLIGGANEIAISAFDEQGTKVEEILTVVYSTAQL